MVRDCGLEYHIEGDEVILEKLLDNQPNPAYNAWVRGKRTSTFLMLDHCLPKLVGAETTRKAWAKPMGAYASGLKPQIRELKSQLHNLQRKYKY